MNSLYRENILDHYKNPRNFGQLPDATISHEENNPLCGDKIGMSIKLSSGMVDKVSFYGVGCAISMASASMLTEKVTGKKIVEVKKINTKDILSMLGIDLTPSRLKCALLPLEVLQNSLALVHVK